MSGGTFRTSAKRLGGGQILGGTLHTTTTALNAASQTSTATGLDIQRHHFHAVVPPFAHDVRLHHKNCIRFGKRSGRETIQQSHLEWPKALPCGVCG